MTFRLCRVSFQMQMDINCRGSLLLFANHVAPFGLQTDCDSSGSCTDNDDAHGTWEATHATDDRISFQRLICGLRPWILGVPVYVCISFQTECLISGSAVADQCAALWYSGSEWIRNGIHQVTLNSGIEMYGYSCKWAHACRTVGVWPNNIHARNLTISHKKGMKERSEDRQQGFNPPPPPPSAQKEIQFEIFQHFAPRASVLIITLQSCLLPPPTLCFHSFFLFLFISPPISLSLPFPSSALPSAFLSAPRWNRKCWFNNSWSEFCIHVTSSAT